MIYILVALKSELSEDKLNKNQYKLLYTGVGKINATLMATKVATQKDCEAIVNYGTAGCLNKNLIGKLSKVSLVYQRDMDARPFAELGETPFEETELKGAMQLSKEGVVLSTGDNFVTSLPEIKSDLVDMEGYAISKVAKHFKKPCLVVKYGSDMADDSSPEDWEKNQASGAQAFLNYINSIKSVNEF